MFENTYRDLRDCYEALTGEDGEDHTLSEEEMSYYNDMVELCRNIVEWSEDNKPELETFDDEDEDDE
jgi:hypothetical protein